MKTRGKNPRNRKENDFSPSRFSTIVQGLNRRGVCFLMNDSEEKDIIRSKPKGSVVLGRTTFIDEIIRKVESQASIGPKIISKKSPTIIPQAVASPSTAHAEIHSETEGSE